MNAGRELDALVAEKVMGWKRLDLGPINGIRWIKGKDVIESEFPFSYSTDISAAWEVVEKLRAVGVEIVVVAHSVKFSCCVNDTETGKTSFLSLAATAPRAICKMALRAVGVDLK